jgi:hypothetical protein
VLGKPGEHDTEIHAILAEYGLPSISYWSRDVCTKNRYFDYCKW